eukprot:scaffold351_cov120-Cylindrotheca_fusiformis.AAC.2
MSIVTYPIHFSSSQKKATDAGHSFSSSNKSEKKYSSGKGKGTSKSKSKSKGSSKSSKKSSKGKGKGKGSSKSSKRSSPTAPSHPTIPCPHPPSPSMPSDLSSVDNDDRPPTPVGQPTRQPSSTECDTNVLLSAYTIEYTLEIVAGDIPSSDDNRDLAVVVDRYISEYLTSQFSGSPTISMTGVDTLTGNLNFQTPVLTADYDSRACFSQGSELPSVATLDAELATMLSTQDLQDQFITTINSLLPAGNIFKTSLVGVEFGSPPVGSRLDSGGGGGNSAAFASGAAGLFILGTGFILYRRRRSKDDDSVGETKLGNKNNASGESTVAGETYTGDTFTTDATHDGHNNEPSPTPTNRSTYVNSTYSWNEGAISRDAWKKDDFIDEISCDPSEDVVFNNHSLEKYDAFLEDSDDEMEPPPSVEDDPILSMYADDIHISNESDEELSSRRDSRGKDSYSVDQIEAMLSYQM